MLRSLSAYYLAIIFVVWLKNYSFVFQKVRTTGETFHNTVTYIHLTGLEGKGVKALEYWIIGSVLAIYMIIMIPIQYANIAETKKELKRSGKTHNEMYEDMSFEKEQMQFNAQGSFFTIPASLIAEFIYFLRHRKERVA